MEGLTLKIFILRESTLQQIMEDPTHLPLLIDDGVYGFDLKQVLWKKQYDQPEHKDILTVILKLINVDLQHCEEKDLRAYFTTTELEIFEDHNVIRDVENREVLARWYDVLLIEI